MKFSDEWNKLKQSEHYGSFKFNGTAADWNSTVRLHFKTCPLKRPYYGVYVVSQKSTGIIIYVGKSGTMCQDGSFKGQDLPKRLVNVGKNNKPRKYEFEQRVVEYGELLIEYVVLTSKSMTPGYLEARLLQAYYDDHKNLPIDNASL